MGSIKNHKLLFFQINMYSVILLLVFCLSPAFANVQIKTKILNTTLQTSTAEPKILHTTLRASTVEPKILSTILQTSTTESPPGCVCGIFLSGQFKKSSKEQPTGNPALIHDQPGIFPCTPGGNRICTNKCLDTVS